MNTAAFSVRRFYNLELFDQRMLISASFIEISYITHGAWRNIIRFIKTRKERETKVDTKRKRSTHAHKAGIYVLQTFQMSLSTLSTLRASRNTPESQNHPYPFYFLYKSKYFHWNRFYRLCFTLYHAANLFCGLTTKSFFTTAGTNHCWNYVLPKRACYLSEIFRWYILLLPLLNRRHDNGAYFTSFWNSQPIHPHLVHKRW